MKLDLKQPFISFQKKPRIIINLTNFLSNQNHSSPPFDEQIGLTIASIFEDFFNQKGDAVTLYICASADNRQMVRYRKFNNWFALFNSDRFIKIDAPIIDKNNVKFPISIIFNSSNPYAEEIAADFIRTVNFFQNNK